MVPPNTTMGVEMGRKGGILSLEVTMTTGTSPWARPGEYFYYLDQGMELEFHR